MPVVCLDVKWDGTFVVKLHHGPTSMVIYGWLNGIAKKTYCFHLKCISTNQYVNLISLVFRPLVLKWTVCFFLIGNPYRMRCYDATLWVKDLKSTDVSKWSWKPLTFTIWFFKGILKLPFYPFLKLQLVPGRAGGGSFRRKRNYVAKKEFAYRMCARRPTSTMPKPFLCCERAFCCSMVVMWFVLMHVMSFDAMWLLVLCRVTWCNAMWCDVRSCDLMRCDCLCCVMSRDAMQCDVMWCALMWWAVICCALQWDGMLWA